MAGLNGLERRVAKLAEGRDARLPSHEEWVMALGAEDPGAAAARLIADYPATQGADYRAALLSLS